MIPEFPSVTLAELMAEPPPVDAGSRSWDLDPEQLVLRCRPECGCRYEIDLERCLTSAEVLDWLCQIAKKAWATDAILADLVRALNAVLDPQSNLCPGGAPRKLTEHQVAELVEGFAAAGGR